MGLKLFWHIYFRICRAQFKKSLRWSGISTLIVALCGIFLSSKNGFLLMSVVTELGLKITPPLLGFTLSSFALVVGFKDDVLMRKLKDYQTSNGISMYLQLVVTFVAMLGAVFVCLLACVVFHLFLSFDIKVCGQLFKIFKYINYACFVLQTFLMFYALFAIKDLLSNLFSLGKSSDSLHKSVKLQKGKQHVENECKEIECNNIFVYVFMGIFYVIKFFKNMIGIVKTK